MRLHHGLGTCGRALFVIAALGTAAYAAPAAAPQFPVERYRLDNGLEVILHEDHTVPLVHVSVWYHAGSGDGVVGKTGLAHLCEHMMFEGSKHVKPGEHFQILGVAGNPDANATTTADRTNYFETVPSNQLETALWLESDRMGFLVGALDQGRLDNQRDVVRNERRQRYENVAFGVETLAIGEALYPEGHPYRHLTIGLHEDIQAETGQDVRDWFVRWYGPGNATLLIAGDIDRTTTRDLVSRWFSTIPARKPPAHRVPTVAAVHLPVRQLVKDPVTKLRRIHYVWPTPRAFSEDAVGLGVLATVLGRQPTGRLYQGLVQGPALAQAVGAGVTGRNLSGEFHASVDVRPGADLAAAESAFQGVLAAAAAQPITDREVRQAIASYEVSFATSFETVSARGEAMQQYNHYRGDPNSFAWELSQIRSMTGERLRALAARYLTPARAEIVTMPAVEGP
jgi:zinc protease